VFFSPLLRVQEASLRATLRGGVSPSRFAEPPTPPLFRALVSEFLCPSILLLYRTAPNCFLEFVSTAVHQQESVCLVVAARFRVVDFPRPATEEPRCPTLGEKFFKTFLLSLVYALTYCAHKWMFLPLISSRVKTLPPLLSFFTLPLPVWSSIACFAGYLLTVVPMFFPRSDPFFFYPTAAKESDCGESYISARGWRVFLHDPSLLSPSELPKYDAAQGATWLFHPIKSWGWLPSLF